MEKEKIKIYYDKECPFCKNYVDFLKLKEDYILILKNAREAKDELDKIKLDINAGFIVLFKGNFYQGSKALNILNKLVRKDTILGKVHIFFYEDNFMSRFLYKLLLYLRKTVLFVLRKDYKI